MLRANFGNGIAISLLVTNLFSGSGAIGQIVPDATLSGNSLVTNNSNNITINGGTKVGGNLFHSFKEFSVPTGSTAFFNNTLDTQNIITRVTGGLSSNIDGTLKANGTANLIFLNPNGINFGTNAGLNLGGSFLGSTANQITFADGTIFSATNPSISPLLTISVPIGLQFGSNPGAINVNGPGANITTDTLVSRLTIGNNPDSLQVASGQSLALIGGAINLQGGILMAPAGRIELGSVSAGKVNFNSSATGWMFNYQGVQSWNDINLSQLALVNVSSSNGGGAISVQGRNVILNGGSVFLMENDGTQPTGDINVNASESFQLNGFSADGTIPSSIFNQTFAGGNSGNINISTKDFLIQNGGFINQLNYGLGQGGNININASDSIQLLTNPSNIGNYNFGLANGGNINISTRNLIALQGGEILTGTLGSGTGGKLTVSATNIEIIGSLQAGVQTAANNSTLGAATYGPGDSGSVAINTSTLMIKNSGEVSDASYSTGKAGNITINALQSIEVNGQTPGALTPSEINAFTTIDQYTQKTLNLASIPSGTSGKVTINTPKLSILNGGLVSVQNQGNGMAGALSINTGSLFLDNKVAITATTANGEGGNIVLQGKNLELRHNSHITTTAGGAGNGGNININTDNLVLLESSNITANAIKGQGGNIEITTQGLFTSADSDVTASSQYGLSGTININNPAVNPSSGLVILPAQVEDPTHQVAVGCAANQGNSLTVTGLGGLPEDPTTTIRGQTIWRDWQDFSRSENPPDQKLSQNSRVGVQQERHQLVEATGWIIDPVGKIKLVTYIPNLTGGSAWLKPFKCNGI